MLGKRTAALEGGARRWLRRLWGLPSVHGRQKWAALWPVLRRLPREGVRLLDAGCGAGTWTLELASRRPRWSVTGIDKEAARVAEAEESRRRLGLPNAAFEAADFLAYRPATPFDVVLAVASSHYLAADGRGPQLFGAFRSWLRPGGVLLMFGPRRAEEAPFVASLPRPPWQAVFSHAELSDLARGAGLELSSLSGRVGPLGTLAKQLDWWGSEGRSALRPVLYPIELLLAAADGPARAASGPSLFWLLEARSPSRGEAA
jgi:trans-aconitate methyltransferase